MDALPILITVLIILHIVSLSFIIYNYLHSQEQLTPFNKPTEIKNPIMSKVLQTASGVFLTQKKNKIIVNDDTKAYMREVEK